MAEDSPAEEGVLAEMDVSIYLGNLLGVFLIATIFSYLWKDNRIYRFAASTYIGFSVAHGMILQYEFLKKGLFSDLAAGKLISIVPLLLGLMCFTSLSRGYRWLNRYALALMLGTSLGLDLRGRAGTVVINLLATMKPLNNLNNIVIIVCAITPMVYFLFSAKNRISIQIGRIGRYAMMVAFGATFANVGLTRLSYLMGAILNILRAFGLAS